MGDGCLAYEPGCKVDLTTNDVGFCWEALLGRLRPVAGGRNPEFFFAVQVRSQRNCQVRGPRRHVGICPSKKCGRSSCRSRTIFTESWRSAKKFKPKPQKYVN